MKLPVKCQCFSQTSFHICATPLTYIALLCGECPLEYLKAAAKSSLKKTKSLDQVLINLLSVMSH